MMRIRVAQTNNVHTGSAHSTRRPYGRGERAPESAGRCDRLVVGVRERAALVEATLVGVVEDVRVLRLLAGLVDLLLHLLESVLGCHVADLPLSQKRDSCSGSAGRCSAVHGRW